MTALDVAAYSTAAEDEARYERAIARRNTAWAHYADARELLDARAAGPADLRPYIGNVNDTQYEYEWACRDLVRARVAWQFERGAHWTQRREAGGPSPR